ncbi:selenide, water dikinase SelD [soil metagenome]
MNDDKIKLTQFSHGAGCGCKIAPQVLEEILQTNNISLPDKNLLVGNGSNDDAAVYDMGNGTAIISTTDFFTPIVDDPFDFGRIAAANAVSDVYAMGGKPLVAIAILGWPVEKLSASEAQQVIEGGRAVCNEAGITLAGGHSIDSPEPFFGLAVTGIVNIEHLKKNNTAQEGDVMFITKPIGVGILSTAQKREKISPENLQILLNQLTQLNTLGEKLGKIKGVTAMTDITGFGLAGHLNEMAEGSGLSAELYYSKLPVLAGAKEYLKERIVPDATYRNWNAYSKKIGFEKGVNVMEAFSILPDPQTNGGLLLAVNPAAVEEVQQLFVANGLSAFTEPVGVFISKADKVITVKN